LALLERNENTQDMDWTSLLSDYRLDRNEKQYTRQKHRPPWQFDFDRVTFSSAFRRLKDKTQVFPLSSSDYIRTRLTHSVEVSAVGRSLGTWIGYFLKENGHLPDQFAPEEIGAIVAAANLAHDIGNPPFGHSGEAAIQNWCKNSETGAQLLDAMHNSQRCDFERYDGNAQGFRILTRLQMYGRHDGGMQLTAATLGAYSKYPVESWPSNTNYPYSAKSTKKPGFFQSEKETFKQLAEILGLPQRIKDRFCWIRHPLAFVTEAADDICYRIVDLEDAYNQKLIREEDFKGILGLILSDEDMKRIGDKPESVRIELVRALCLNRAIPKIVEAFQNNYANIIQGTFDKDLVSVTDLSKPFEAIEDLQKRKVYCNERVLKIEIAGFSVIGGLLDHFLKAANYLTRFGELKGSEALCKKVIDLVPEQFFCDGNAPSADPYLRLLEMTDFISGMTDSYALSLFRSLTGIQLP
jgi:dGTPase